MLALKGLSPLQFNALWPMTIKLTWYITAAGKKSGRASFRNGEPKNPRAGRAPSNDDANSVLISQQCAHGATQADQLKCSSKKGQEDI